MRVERAGTEEVDRRRCGRHLDSGQRIFSVLDETWVCSSCLKGLSDDRPPKLSEAMVEDMKRLGIEVAE